LEYHLGHSANLHLLLAINSPFAKDIPAAIAVGLSIISFGKQPILKSIQVCQTFLSPYLPLNYQVETHPSNLLLTSINPTLLKSSVLAFKKWFDILLSVHNWGPI